jgi:hypothetical protein
MISHSHQFAAALLKYKGCMHVAHTTITPEKAPAAGGTAAVRGCYDVSGPVRKALAWGRP